MSCLTCCFVFLHQGLNSMFEVYLVGNNSHHFIISPTSVQGKADIRIRVAIPLDYETVDRYDFDVRLPLLSWDCWAGTGRSEYHSLKSHLPLWSLRDSRAGPVHRT